MLADMGLERAKGRCAASKQRFFNHSQKGIHGPAFQNLPPDAPIPRQGQARRNGTLRRIPPCPQALGAIAVENHNTGPDMTSILQILLMLLDVAQFILIAHIIMGWLINFQVLNLRQPLVSQLWFGLNRLLEPMYSRIRAFLPNMGGLDLAPLIAILVIMGLRIVLVNNAGLFL